MSRAGHRDLANQIVWVSQTHPYEGYDILSFDNNGTRRLIEVKATVSVSKRFEISDNEWRRADELRAQYQIYRVTSIESAPSLKQLPDPVSLLAAGRLSKTASSWAVTYK